MDTRNSKSTWIVAVAAALWLGGCSFAADVDNTEIEARRCTSDAECGEGFVCDTEPGFCRPVDGADTSMPGDTSPPGDTSMPGDTVSDDTTVDDTSMVDTTVDDTSMPGDTSMPPQCNGPEIDCNGTCVNPNNNDMFCGDCDTSCAANESCQGGTCVADTMCGNGETDCNGTCFDLQTSDEHCGDCATSCGPMQSCQDGSCVDDMMCPAGETDCSGMCVDPDVDEANCGGCGIQCAAGAQCQGATCVCGSGAGSESGCDLTLPNVSDAQCGGGGSKECQLTCASGFGDDNDDHLDGCEAAQ